jgi:predicted DNA-binding transcriptional regulator YafY
MADEHGVSTKTISRDISRIKDFLAENRELTGNAELAYSRSTKSYRLTSDDRKKLEEIVRKELYQYCEIKHDSDNVVENVWRLANMIYEKKEITIHYYKVNREYAEHRIQPVSLMFVDYYFYVIAFYQGKYEMPYFFRVDRIRDIVEHRKPFDAGRIPNFDEGLLRKQCQLMMYGKLRKIRFLYTGLSVQAILDKLPTAKILERKRGEYLIEAEVYGVGIKMYLLSHGADVKVLSPAEFVEDMRNEIEKMQKLYD